MNLQEMRKLAIDLAVGRIPEPEEKVTDNSKRKSKPKVRHITSRKYDVIAIKLSDKRFRKTVKNVSFKQAKELSADFRKQGFSRVDIIEVLTRISDIRGKTKELIFTPKTFEFPLVGSIPYVEAKLSQRQIVRKNIAIVKADAIYFSGVNTEKIKSSEDESSAFGPREIRVIR